MSAHPRDRAEGRGRSAGPRRGGRRVPFRPLLSLLSIIFLAAGSAPARLWFPQPASDLWEAAHPFFPHAALLLAAFPLLAAMARGRGSQSAAIACAAALGAAVAGQPAHGAAALLILSVAEAALAWAFHRARSPLERLLSRAPFPGGSGVGEGGAYPGDEFLVGPAQLVPADGVIVDGASEVDESHLAGEGAIAAKGPSDLLLAGSLNLGGMLRARASHTGEESLAAQAAARLREALAAKPPLQRAAERIARFYTPGAMLLALVICAAPPLLLGSALQPWVLRGAALLLVASPVAFLVAAPAALMPALNGAARRGVFVKGPEVLEALARVDAVCFDVTGTLTRGRFEVVETAPFGPVQPHELVALAAGIEAAASEHGVDHPIGRAVVDEARRLGCAPVAVARVHGDPASGLEAEWEGHRYLLGSSRALRSRGLHPGFAARYAERHSQEGRECLILAEDGRPIGVIAFEDGLKEESRRVLQRLGRAAGLRILLVTGGSLGRAELLARTFEAADFAGERSPEEKAGAIEKWKEGGATIAAVGSSPADVKALEAAHVGIALGAARSRELFLAGDVAVMANDLAKLPYAFALARRTRAAIRRHVAAACAVKLAALALAAAGELTMVEAAWVEAAFPLVLAAAGSRLAGRLRLGHARTGPPGVRRKGLRPGGWRNGNPARRAV